MPVEGQPRLGAIPSDELVDSVLVDPTRGGRAEAVEHCSLAMIQIRQSKQSATIGLILGLPMTTASYAAAFNYGRSFGRRKFLR